MQGTNPCSVCQEYFSREERWHTYIWSNCFTGQNFFLYFLIATVDKNQFYGISPSQVPTLDWSNIEFSVCTKVVLVYGYKRRYGFGIWKAQFSRLTLFKGCLHTDGLAQDCSNSSALAMELPQSCAKPSIHLPILDTFCVNMQPILQTDTTHTVVVTSSGLRQYRSY